MAMTRGESAGRLPWPAEWPSRIRLRSLAPVLFLAILAVGIPAFGFFSLASGNYADGVFGLVSSPMVFAVAAVGFLTRRLGRRRGVESVHSDRVGELGQRAVVVPYSRALTAAMLLVPFSTILFFGFFVFVTSLVISESGWGDPWAIAWFAFSLLAILYALAFLVETLRRRIVRGTLALSPAGVHHRSWALSSFSPWDNVFYVAPHEFFEGPLIRVATYDDDEVSFRKTSRLWKQPEFTRMKNMVVRGNHLSVNPALAYYALKFYHEHPEARSELGAEAGVERLRRADVLG